MKLVAYRSQETVVRLEFAGNNVVVIADDEYQHKRILATFTFTNKGEINIVLGEHVKQAEQVLQE